ncbi:3'-5' exonuclease [Virgibacillus halotolerans]|uniref:3'-5' exonuclease n=1 Tax=Virgibacillus halotolerans TaxID=1071053 RepID=UPI0023BA86ED|nr:3'-5' exonuclease [Virgibacillus halotolerans]
MERSVSAMNFISIDFETANEQRHSPCAIGVVVANEHEIIDEFYSLINPLMAFKSMNTYIHGITEKDVQEAPTFKELWPTLHKYLAHHVVVAHNASFDMSVLRKTLDYFHLPYPEMEYLCTVNIAKKVWPDLHNHKLNTLAASHGITFEHHHALEDARVAAKVLMKAMETYQTGFLDQFLEKCQMTKGKIYDHGYFPPKLKRSKRSNKLYI